MQLLLAVEPWYIFPEFGSYLGNVGLNVEAKLRLLVATTLLLGIAFSEIAVAKQKCATHTLSPGNDRVAAPSGFFFLKNIGPKSAMIVTDDGEIITLDAGNETGFFGDKRFDYYIKLVTSGDTTTIEVCTSSSTVSSEDADFHKGYEALYSRGDAETALRFWIPLAERGNKCAQSSLGDLYSIGSDAVQQDYKKAVGWYRKSAAQGFYVAQYKLGLMYEKGRGVPRDIVLSHMWMLIAASQEYPGAVRKVIFNNKNMSPADIAKAKELAPKFEKKKFNGCRSLT